jgi:hypothetical protein
MIFVSYVIEDSILFNKSYGNESFDTTIESMKDIKKIEDMIRGQCLCKDTVDWRRTIQRGSDIATPSLEG